MTQQERWEAKYKAYIDFTKANKRRPSKYKAEERDNFNWFKYNKKLYNQKKMPKKRIKPFLKLLKIAEKYRHVNQHMTAKEESKRRASAQSALL